MSKIQVGVIGCGYWGPNLIRNFNLVSNCEMVLCCDLDERKLSRISAMYPFISTTTKIDDVLHSDYIDAIAIATPVSTHATIGAKCLTHDKHILVEKPLAASSDECVELIAIAEERNKVLMVGHTFEYTAAVLKTKQIIESGDLGDIYYIRSVRANLGIFQQDINVVWDLAPHDISIIFSLLNQYPTSVNAQGKAHFKSNIEDVVTTTINFPNGAVAFIHNSWLDPNKLRNTTIVGSRKMLVYDDISTNEKIKIFDKGVETPPYYNSYAEFHFSYRYGDIYTPRLNEYEPLRYECEHFISCILEEKKPISDGYSGLRVVTVLESINKSLRNNGAKENIDYSKLDRLISKKVNLGLETEKVYKQQA